MLYHDTDVNLDSDTAAAVSCKHSCTVCMFINMADTNFEHNRTYNV